MPFVVDADQVRSIIVGVIGEHSTIRDAREAGVYVIPARDRAIEMCLPLAPRTIHKLTTIPWASRVEFDDLEGAACQGIVEGIDRFQPRKTYKGQPIKVNTYLYLWIRKRVLEEVAANHWSIMRPARALMESYMKGELDPFEREAYMDDYLRPAMSEDDRSDKADRYVDREWGDQLRGTFVAL